MDKAKVAIRLSRYTSLSRNVNEADGECRNSAMFLSSKRVPNWSKRNARVIREHRLHDGTPIFPEQHKKDELKKAQSHGLAVKLGRECNLSSMRIKIIVNPRIKSEMKVT